MDARRGALTALSAVVHKDQTATVWTTVEVPRLDRLSRIMSRLESIRDVFNVVRDTPGVRKVTDLLLNGARADLRLRPEEFPVLAEVRLEDEGGRPL